jgi:hypothetical protein
MEGTPRDEAYVLGVICSMPFDWYARQVVETHVTVEFMNSAPIPRPSTDDPLRRRAEEIAGRLAAVDERYGEWANAVGVPVGKMSSEDREDLVAELDAVVATLYGLSRKDVVYIFENFQVGWDYRSRLASVNEHLDHLRAVAGR